MSSLHIKSLLKNKFIIKLYNNLSILGVHNNQYNLAFYNNQWIGNNLCGPSSVICASIIPNDIKYKVFTNNYGFDDYSEDHTFIVLEDGTYIDPTYKQFLNYYNYDLDNFYIGTYENLKHICNKLNKNEKDIMRYWKKQTDITNKVNLFLETNHI